MNGIVSGQDSVLQIGLAGGWADPGKATRRVPLQSETFKSSPNYKSVDALVGAKTMTAMSIMSYKASGGFKTYVTADLVKLLAYLCLGSESSVVNSGNQKKHNFKLIPSGLSRSLPGYTAEIDRIFEKVIYDCMKINSWSFEASQEDFLYFDCDGEGHAENVQTALVKTIIEDTTAGASAVAASVVIPDGFIVADGNYVGKVVRITDSDGNESYFKISTSTAATDTLALATYPTSGGATAAADAFNGMTLEILDFDMTRKAGNTYAPQLLDLSDMEYFKFLHARLYIEGGSTDYVVKGASGMGKAGDKVYGVPTTLTGAAEYPIIVEAKDKNGFPCLFKYSGTAITRSTKTLTFSDTPSGADSIKSIHTSAGAINTGWGIYEELYDEATSVKVSGNNNLKTGSFGANGSPYQNEVQPQGRDVSVDVTFDMSKRYSDLRKRKINTGAPVSLKLTFVTMIMDIDGEVKTSFDVNGDPYKLEFILKSCYLPEGSPNISGSESPTVSVSFKAREIPGVSEAIEIDVYDQDASTVASTKNTSRDDGN